MTTDRDSTILRKLAYAISTQDGEIKKGMGLAYDIVKEAMEEY